MRDLLAPTPLFMPRAKNVWVAGLLAAFFGPAGMAYSTVSGTIVMFAARLALTLLFGRAFVWLARLAFA